MDETKKPVNDHAGAESELNVRLGVNDAKYLIERLEKVIELIKSHQNHMAIAKLLADISALRNIR